MGIRSYTVERFGCGLAPVDAAASDAVLSIVEQRGFYFLVERRRERAALWAPIGKRNADILVEFVLSFGLRLEKRFIAARLASALARHFQDGAPYRWMLSGSGGSREKNGEPR